MSGFHQAATYGRTDTGGLLSSRLVIAFAATTQPERARAFYGYALGLGLIEETPQALVFDAAGTMLFVQKVRSLAPAAHVVLGWRVDDLLATMRALATRGVTCEVQPGRSLDADGVWIGPTGAKVAWFRDPDGNVLSLTQFPPS
jgi:catechol 2,3-dioxygenase-like lactoylglutathione lyase family enzyme